MQRDRLTTNLTSPGGACSRCASRRVDSKHGTRGPCFETAATRPPQHEVLLCRTADLNHRARAAVDVDGDAGDEGAGVRAQEAGHAGEFLGLADAADRDAALGHALQEL